jgi:hypothetical protein
MPDATVPLVPVADLGAHLPPHHALFGADVGPDGRLWTSWVPRASLEAIWDDGGVLAAGAAQVFAVGTAGVERIVVPALPLPVAHAQPLPGGEVVCVARWCRRYRDGTADPNAFVVSAGQLVAQHVIGDDVDHVATTPEGLIWASYDDEGIFGNRGWQHADSAGVLGAGGLGP